MSIPNIRERSSAFSQLPITDEDKRKILWDNCAAYYGMTLECNRARIVMAHEILDGCS